MSEYMRCRCGSYWFVPFLPGDRKAGVAFQLDGVASSHFGSFVCAECNQPRPDPDPELVRQRLVKLSGKKLVSLPERG